MAAILTPEELAARLKVRKSWVYEKTRPRCPNPIPCLPLGQYLRFDWATIAEFDVGNPARPDEVADAPDRAIQVNGSIPHSEESGSIGEFNHAPTIANECARYLPRFGCASLPLNFLPRHLLGHEKQQLQIVLRRPAEQAAKLLQQASVLPRTAPSDFVRSHALREIW